MCEFRKGGGGVMNRVCSGCIINNRTMIKVSNPDFKYYNVDKANIHKCNIFTKQVHVDIVHMYVSFSHITVINVGSVSGELRQIKR